MGENQNVKKHWYRKWWVWVIAVLVIGAIGNGVNKGNNTQPAHNAPAGQAQSENAGNSPAPSPTPAEEVLTVDYNKLHGDYADNPINADKQYKGKLLKLTGDIEKIDREISQETYITFHVGDKYSLRNVRLTFKRSEEDKIAQLQKGQTITVVGRCTGTLISDLTVALKDCYLSE